MRRGLSDAAKRESRLQPDGNRPAVRRDGRRKAADKTGGEEFRSRMETDPPAAEVVHQAQEVLLGHQSPEGYWWYTLEANESIGAGFIQLMHFLNAVDPAAEKGIASRLLKEQRADGSWPLFYGGPGDLSVTIEAYFALRLAGHNPSDPPLARASRFILEKGGLTHCRIFTRIHLALFGLVPWDACPAMPVWFIFLPTWLGVSIYDFSSWARASIVPLLILLDKKPVHPLPFSLEELYAADDRSFPPTVTPPKALPGKFFIRLNRVLKKMERLPVHPFKKLAVKQCEKWTRNHVARTVDIYPAMAYAALAMKAMGYGLEDLTIQQALAGLRSFQQSQEGTLHQQCCISPLWDTPWAALTLIESGIPPDDPRLLKAARYLIQKQITDFRGDWRHKNRKGEPGGWAFEFQNDYFPDVDDTIEALFFLKKVALPAPEKEASIRRGLAWLLSMQSSNGGWAAFDRNNTARWVNQIPFSDHGACLDPPTPDVTGRMLELLSLFDYTPSYPVVAKALRFLRQSQEANGSWRGRWGVNFVYGTWCVLQGLAAIQSSRPLFPAESVQRASRWLQSVQNDDGGWGESCLSDEKNCFVPLGHSVPSQTAWGTMGLLAAGERENARRGIDWLLKNQQEGVWEEKEFTGTGFPGHFYIRYHGYRHYFPLLALGKSLVK